MAWFVNGLDKNSEKVGLFKGDELVRSCHTGWLSYKSQMKGAQICQDATQYSSWGFFAPPAKMAARAPGHPDRIGRKCRGACWRHAL